MALSIAALRSAIRAGDSARETVEVTRLRNFAVAFVNRYAPNAPETIRDEAAIRLAGYIFDSPSASGQARHANAFLNSGAQAIVGPYKARRGVTVPPPPPPAIWIMAWENARVFTEESYLREDGAIQGPISAGLRPTANPAGVGDGGDLYLGLWISGADAVLDTVHLGVTSNREGWPEGDRHELEVGGLPGWSYPSTQRLTDGNATVHVGSESVVHVRYAVEAARPWRGLSPLQVASITGKLSSEVSQALADEASGPRGAFLPLPSPTSGEDATLDGLRADVKGSKGQLLMVESMASAWGGAAANAPAQDWMPKRFGASPPAALVTLAEQAFSEVVSAVGVPAILFSETASGAGFREGYRQLLLGLISPLGRLVSAELSEKLERPVSISWKALMATDIQGRARAYKALTDAGLPAAEAKGLAVRAALLADADVAAIVDSRVWFSVLPPEPDIGSWMPAVVVQGQDAEDEYAMGGPIGLARGQIQVDAWADDRAGCEALREAVREAMGDFHSDQIAVTGTQGGTPQYDPDAKLWLAVLFFDVWGGS